jgi:hypothetical protein
VVHTRHGWWYPEQDGEEPNLFGVWKSNINNLIPHFDIGKLGFGASMKSVFCSIKKVSGLSDGFEVKKSLDIIRDRDLLDAQEGVKINWEGSPDYHLEHRILS